MEERPELTLTALRWGRPPFGVRLSESRAALAADEEAYKLIRLRYEGGLANYQSVLLAEDAVLQARVIVADLDARAFTLDVQLVQALGGGYAQS